MYQDELWNYFINNADKFVLEIPVLFKVYKIYTLDKFTAIVNTKRNTCAIFEGDDCILSTFNEKKSREMFNCLNNKKINMYFKVVKEKLTFEEAIEAFKKGEIIRYKHYEPLCPSKIKNIENVGFTIEQIHSNDWSVVVVDDHMEDLKWQVSDMVHEIGIDIDTRFYNEEKMDILTYWQILNDKMFFDDKLAYEIIKWVYDNKKYKK